MSHLPKQSLSIFNGLWFLSPSELYTVRFILLYHGSHVPAKWCIEYVSSVTHVVASSYERGLKKLSVSIGKT